MRVDKYLWCIRAFKTRSQATDACRKGHVKLNDLEMKPSRNIAVGDVLKVYKKPVLYTYKITDLPKSRMSAKLVENYADNLTPQEELDKLRNDNLDGFYVRDKGAGRPTKKERRDISKYFGGD